METADLPQNRDRFGAEIFAIYVPELREFSSTSRFCGFMAVSCGQPGISIG
jgi:hypothetical protein